MPSYRSLVLQTLSLLNSALPQLSFLTLSLVNQLLGAADMLKSRDTEEVFNHINSAAQVTHINMKTLLYAYFYSHKRSCLMLVY